MILGIGMDLIEIERFVPWITYPNSRLRKIFSEHEISYSLHEDELAAARLAARFAAKEAFFKALSCAQGRQPCTLIEMCPLIEVVQQENRAPYIRVQKNELTNLIGRAWSDTVAIHLTLTHSVHTAGAFIILERT